jgi:hypothetical protein
MGNFVVEAAGVEPGHQTFPQELTAFHFLVSPETGQMAGWTHVLHTPLRPRAAEIDCRRAGAPSTCVKRQRRPSRLPTIVTD